MSALALLEAHKQEVPALLADPARAAVVDRLSRLVDLPPDAALPWIGLSRAAAAAERAAVVDAVPGSGGAAAAAGGPPPACALVADALGRGERGALEWLGRVPKGAALEAAEERTLDRMRPRVGSPDALRALFEVRFGIPAPAELDAAALDALYAIVARLPPGHIQQERIKEIVQEDLGTLGAGLYAQGAGIVTIDDNVHPGESTETFHPDDMQAWRTAAEMQQVYGFDAAALEAQVRAGRVQAEVTAGVTRYRLTEQTLDLFTKVVLHEIGHSVDELLGQRTSPVYDFADWREYDDGAFDVWAAEMGGWDRVTPADRAEIRKVWIDAARGKTKGGSAGGPGSSGARVPVLRERGDREERGGWPEAGLHRARAARRSRVRGGRVPGHLVQPERAGRAGGAERVRAARAGRVLRRVLRGVLPRRGRRRRARRSARAGRWRRR